ncbi:MAG: hypothetical protein K0S56_62 [Microvirga sp.]|jgi:hypothetical protein|nr:hypothetical protein [Microvirga sp.]
MRGPPLGSKEGCLPRRDEHRDSIRRCHRITVYEGMALCEDLAEAEAVLARWERSSSSVNEASCTEYRELVMDLAAELATELDRHSQ